jgi:hypothetical protein
MDLVVHREAETGLVADAVPDLGVPVSNKPISMPVPPGVNFILGIWCRRSSLCLFGIPGADQFARKEERPFHSAVPPPANRLIPASPHQHRGSPLPRKVRKNPAYRRPHCNQ